MKHLFIFTVAILLTGCTAKPAILTKDIIDSNEQEIIEIEEKIINEENRAGLRPANTEPLEMIEPQKEEISPPSNVNNIGDVAPLIADWFAVWKPFLPTFSINDLEEVLIKPIDHTMQQPLEQYDYLLDLEEQLDYPIIFSSTNREMLIALPPAEDSPDSEVGLITPEKDIYARILFCGPSCGFDGAIWLDDARFIITGYGDDIPTCDDGRCVTPHLYLFNVAKNTMTLYYGPSVSAEVFFGE